MSKKCLHIGTATLSFEVPQVMAILNLTPDSFYAPSRAGSVDALLARARQACADGATILDIGACSTRPGFTPLSVDEEWDRLAPALEALRSELPDVVLSVDTYQAVVAQRVRSLIGDFVINDISGGNDDMFALASSSGLPYVLTRNHTFPLAETRDFESDLHLLRAQEVPLILDPGVGFLGSVEADYEALRLLPRLAAHGYPVLVGVSRKSLIWRPLGITPSDSLTPTQVLHMAALERGASILRVHDVAAARDTLALFALLTGANHPTL